VSNGRKGDDVESLTKRDEEVKDGKTEGRKEEE
jgi:hypothetical protein